MDVTIWIILLELFGGVARIFSGGGRPGHLKAITRSTEGSGGGSPSNGSEVSFLKRLKVLGKESIFQKINIFLQEKSIFSNKNFEKLNIFYKNFSIFSKNYFKLSIFMIPYKSREMPSEFFYLIEKFIKQAQK